MQEFQRLIQKQYESLRDKAQINHKQRIQDIYSQVPRVEAIDREIRSCAIEIGRGVLLSSNQERESFMQHLESKIEHLRQEKAILLTENNIPLASLELSFECPYCQDTGTLSTHVPCSCYKQRMTKLIYDMSHISRQMDRENFKAFDLNIFSDQAIEGYEQTPKRNMELILSKAEQFVYEFKTPGKSLLFYGSTGLGKTFLCNAIGKALMDKGHIVVYQTAFKILEILQKNRFGKANETTQDDLAYNLLFESDLLIIDDLGTEMVNSFSNAELFNIINSRLIADKKVLISTNLTPIEMMDVYSSRISSRIFGHFEIFHFYGKDLRWESR